MQPGALRAHRAHGVSEQELLGLVPCASEPVADAQPDAAPTAAASDSVHRAAALETDAKARASKKAACEAAAASTGRLVMASSQAPGSLQPPARDVALASAPLQAQGVCATAGARPSAVKVCSRSACAYLGRRCTTAAEPAAPPRAGSTHTSTDCYARGRPNTQDLARAAEKAMASGLGDWHLQPLQDTAPEFRERLLLGPLGPETLTNHHGLSEEQCLSLYGLLHRHTAGFQAEAAALAAGAARREQLLAGIWRAFAQLWDDTVAVRGARRVLAMHIVRRMHITRKCVHMHTRTCARMHAHMHTDMHAGAG